MSVPSKKLDKARKKKERNRINRAVRLVEQQSKDVAPILATTFGQHPDNAHRAIHTDVFYLEGGESFFVSAAAAQATDPSKRVRTTTPRAAIRKGLTWDSEDKKAYEASVKARREDIENKYKVDDATGARKLRG